MIKYDLLSIINSDEFNVNENVKTSLRELINTSAYNSQDIETLITNITGANTIEELNNVEESLKNLKTGANTLKNVADTLMKIHFNEIPAESKQKLIETKNSLKGTIEQLNQQQIRINTKRDVIQLQTQLQVQLTNLQTTLNHAPGNSWTYAGFALSVLGVILGLTSIGLVWYSPPDSGSGSE